MNRQTNHVQKELRRAGADELEAKNLALLADQLRPVRKNIQKSRRMPIILTGFAATVTALAMLVVIAQNSLPGSWMYPTKKASERVAVAIDPSFRATIMMRRAHEVQKLVAARSDTNEVLAALAAYKTEAGTYATHTTNYRAFESCKRSLRQAQAQAHGVEAQAISRTLDSLATV